MFEIKYQASPAFRINVWDLSLSLFFFPFYKGALASNSLALFQDSEMVLRSLFFVGAGTAANFRGRGLLTP